MSDVKVEWSGEPLTTNINHKIFYSAAVVNDESICLGDHVFVRPDDPSIPMYIAQVRSMWQDSKSGEKLFHARFVVVYLAIGRQANSTISVLKHLSFLWISKMHFLWIFQVAESGQ